MLVLLFLLRGIRKEKKKDKQQSHYKLAWVQSLSYIYAFNTAWESHFKEIQLLHALVLTSWEVHLYSSIFLDYLECFLKAFKSREDQSERSLAAVLFFFWLCRQTKNLQEVHSLCFEKQENWDRKFKVVCKNTADREFDRSTASPQNKVWLTSRTLVSNLCFLRIQAMGSAGQNYCGFSDFGGYVPVYCCWKWDRAG